MKKTFLSLVLLTLALNFSTAIIINSVDTPTLNPGQEGLVSLEVENILNDKAEDVSLKLNFEDLPFIPIGTSEQSVDEIDDDDDENFVFRIKASNDVTPGNYEIPYELTYTIETQEKTKSGTIGLQVASNPELTFSISTENAVKGKQGRITIKIINKGFSDARFVSIRALPEDFTLLSESQEYIGTIDSDDFETASFDVLFKNINTDFTAIVEYKDFDNKRIIKDVSIPVKVYSQEKAIELGIIQPSKTLGYVITVIVIILIIIIWRSIKKRKRMKKSMQNQRL